MTARDEAEHVLFARFAQIAIPEVRAVFILGSPRTGSTLAYQLIAHCLRCTYFDNFLNDEYAEHPALAVEATAKTDTKIDFTSNYGKTDGRFAPSEASRVFARWFGGEHPSQTKSNRVLPGQRAHLLDSFRSMWGLTGVPIVCKNAWNCFRAEDLASLLPGASFLWVRRDLHASALSDLESRYRQGSPTIWNSATTANYEDIMRRPYWEQVVEQQFEYTLAIRESLESIAPDRSTVVWYEDLCRDPAAVIRRLTGFAGLEPTGKTPPVLETSSGHAALGEDAERIQSHIDTDPARFAELRHTPATDREN